MCDEVGRRINIIRKNGDIVCCSVRYIIKIW